MALNNAQIRAIVIKRAIARKAKAANDNTDGGPQTPSHAKRAMPRQLLANCIAAAGFDQSAHYA